MPIVVYDSVGLTYSYIRGHAKIPVISEKVKFSLFLCLNL